MNWRSRMVLTKIWGLAAIWMAILGLASVPAIAQQSSDPQAVARGMNFAYRWCSTCHHDSNIGAPRFAELARADKTTPDYLKRTVENPPHNMMKFTIGQNDIDNMSAYFASLPAKSQ